MNGAVRGLQGAGRSGDAADVNSLSYGFIKGAGH